MKNEEDEKIDLEQQINLLALNVQKGKTHFTLDDVANQIGVKIYEDLGHGYKIYPQNDAFLTLAELTFLARILKSELDNQ